MISIAEHNDVVTLGIVGRARPRACSCDDDVSLIEVIV